MVDVARLFNRCGKGQGFFWLDMVGGYSIDQHCNYGTWFGMSMETLRLLRGEKNKKETIQSEHYLLQPGTGYKDIF